VAHRPRPASDENRGRIFYSPGESTKTSPGPSNLTVTTTTKLEGNTTTTEYPDGTKRVVTRAPDPRFDLQAEYVSKVRTELPSGLDRQFMVSSA